VWHEALAQAVMLGFRPASLQKHSSKQEFRIAKTLLSPAELCQICMIPFKVLYGCGVLLVAAAISLS
jgi:hypothetical protein